jgi:uncharacterized protein (DUF2336 family)
VILKDRQILEYGRQMLDAPSWPCRAKAAERLAELYARGTLGLADAQLLEELFRLVRHDPEALVRRVLAESLKHARTLSRDFVLDFVGDRADVAAPLIACSPLLDDGDLLRILRDESLSHGLAVAGRVPLSPLVAEAILAKGDEALIAAVLRNGGAEIREEALLPVVAAHGRSPVVLQALARRRPLPARIAEALGEAQGHDEPGPDTQGANGPEERRHSTPRALAGAAL